MTTYQKYVSKMQRIADVAYSSAVLQWDQEVYLPAKGAEGRARQLSTLSGIAHELSTEDEIGKLISDLKSDSSLSLKEKANVRESLRSYNIQKKYTTQFVELLNRTISEAFQAWHEARTKNDFKIFQPLLQKLTDLKKQECEMLGYEDHPYNALIDQYEPGMTVKELDVLFADVKKELVPFVKQIFEKPKPVSDFLNQNYDRQKQWDFGLKLLKQMHFNFEAGRQDISVHPFTTSFSSQDVRVTTRINEHDLKEMIWSCIHEGGHALYEQGLDFGDYGLPSAEAISLGIHESQSRIWENNVGRSLAYWKCNYKELQAVFPEQLKNISLEEFYHSINLVQPSLIRTSADELTYHFHVMIRYEIEKALLDGSVKVEELPALWNEKYKAYLNIDVPDDSRGVLQDVHWSHGSFGYFPTYSLGSFYAAQFFNKAQKDIPQLNNQIEKGDLLPFLSWLREKIHHYGKTYRADELCKMVTGEELNFSHFMNYAIQKFGKIYDLDFAAQNVISK